MAYQSTNPNTGQLLQQFENLSPAQLEAMLAAAEACFQTWKHKRFAARAAVPGVCAAERGVVAEVPGAAG